MMMTSSSSRGQRNTTFREEYFPQKRNVNQQDGVLSAASTTNEKRLYTIFKTMILLCALMSVLRPTIQEKIMVVM